MAEVYGYFNGLEYDEKFPMMRVASLIPTGVYDDSLHVSAGTGLNVYVAAGKAWVNGYFYSSDATKQITIDIADADNTRKDVIILRLDTVNRLMTVAYKKGNPSVYPTPPTLQRNNDQYELQLAEILVPAGSASISAATITDTRSDSGLCGITAGFQGLDVAGLTAQAQAKFDTWFANLQNQLDSNQAGNLQNQIDAINNSKGKAGGLMALPATLPGIGKILKMGTGGVPAEAVDGTDYGVRIKNILGASVTQNNTDYALTEDYTNYKMLLIIGTENTYSNFYASLLLPVDLIGINSAYITRFWLSATNKLDFWFPNTKTIHASAGFTSPYRITNIYGIK